MPILSGKKKMYCPAQPSYANRLELNGIASITITISYSPCIWALTSSYNYGITSKVKNFYVQNAVGKASLIILPALHCTVLYCNVYTFLKN